MLSGLSYLIWAKRGRFLCSARCGLLFLTLAVLQGIRETRRRGKKSVCHVGRNPVGEGNGEQIMLCVSETSGTWRCGRWVG